MQVVTVYDMIHERFADLFTGPKHDQFRERKRRCVMEADVVICISEATCQDVQNFYGFDSNRIQVIPLGYNDSFRALGKGDFVYNLFTTKPFLLYVGSRAYYKNFKHLLSAYSRWGGQKEVDLVVVGQNWSEDEKKWLVKHGIQDQVHLLVDIDDETLCILYNQATAFIYPSLYEGFGIPLLEAMACGCPVVASHIPSTVEIAGNFPIYFKPHQVESLLAALDIALSEGRDTKRVRMGFKIAGKYSWDETAKQTLHVYHAL